MSVPQQNYIMSCLGFSNNYFDKTVVTAQGSFTRDIRNVYLRTLRKTASATWTLYILEKVKRE